MAGWSREHYAPRDAQRSISHQHTNSIVPAHTSSTSASWDQVNPNHPSAGPPQHSSSTSEFNHQPISTNDQYHRSISGPATSSFSSNRNYSQAVPPGYTSGSQTHHQVGPPSQQYSQQPGYPVTAGSVAEPHSATSSHSLHDREMHTYNSAAAIQQPAHHGYSSSAPVTTSFYHHQQQQNYPHAPSNASTLSSQHPHHHQQNYPLASPSFSDSHHEFHPHLNPFEVKHRRRTTRSQFKLLESTFRENPKPNAAIRKDISQQLDMPIRAVQIWFQNRRAKAKAVAKRDSTGRPYQSADGTQGGGGGGGGSSSSDADVSRMSNSNVSLDNSFEKDDDRDLKYVPMHHQRSYSSNYDINGSTNISSSSSSGGHSGYNHSVPSSSQMQGNTFKMPLRPSRLDIDGPSRRMTTNSMPTSASSSTFGFNNSPIVNSSGHPVSAPNSASYDESVFAHRPMTSSSVQSAPYDDRYRFRGSMTSPSVLAHETIASPSLQYNRMAPHQASSANLQAPSHDQNEGRRSSLPDNQLLPLIGNPGTQQIGNRAALFPEGGASYTHQQQQSSQSHPHNEYWTKY